jgi:O-antigen/teichoic acid export membrane protein
MIRRSAYLLTPYIVKAATILAQVASTLALALIMEPTQLGIYFAALAAASLCASAADLGAVRMSFRYIAGSADPSVLISAILLARAISVPCLGLIFYQLAGYAEIDATVFFLILPSTLLAGINNVNRYLLIARGRQIGAALVEAMQPAHSLTAIVAVGIVLAQGGTVRASTIAIVLSVASVLAFAASTRTANATRYWLRAAARLIARTKRKPNLRSTLKYIGHSKHIGIEALLTSLLYNLPTLAANMLAGGSVTALVGIVQRLLAAANSLIGALISAELLRYYRVSNPRNHLSRILRHGSYAATLGFITAFVMYLASESSWTPGKLRPFVRDMQQLGVLLPVIFAMLLISGCISQLSIANRLVRVRTSATLGAVVFYAVFLLISGKSSQRFDHIDVVIGMTLAMLMSCAIQVRWLLRASKSPG